MKALLILNLIAVTLECYLLSNIINKPEPLPACRYYIESNESDLTPTIEYQPLESESSKVVDPQEQDCFDHMVNMIKRFESFKPTPYLCAAGVRTIGYGFTESKYLKMKRMTEPQASKILVEEIIPRYQSIVRKLVKVPLTSNQECALVSFTFNCGESNLERVVDASRNRLNKGNYNSVLQVLPRYTKVKVGSKVKTLKGLVTRRKQEAALFAGKAVGTLL
jgi:lysozyme